MSPDVVSSINMYVESRKGRPRETRVERPRLRGDKNRARTTTGNRELQEEM